MDQDTKLLEELYQKVKTELMDVLKKQINFTDIKDIIKSAIRAIENLPGQNLTLQEKCNICKNLMDYILNDLEKNGKIPETIDKALISSIGILTPVIYELILQADQIRIKPKKNCCVCI